MAGNVQITLPNAPAGARFSHVFWAAPFAFLCLNALIGSQGAASYTEMDALFAAVLVSPLPLLLLRLDAHPKRATQWCLAVFVVQAGLSLWTLRSSGVAGISRQGPFFPIFWRY